MAEYKATLKRVYDDDSDFCCGCALEHSGKNTLCEKCVAHSDDGIKYRYEISEAYVDMGTVEYEARAET